MEALLAIYLIVVALGTGMMMAAYAVDGKSPSPSQIAALVFWPLLLPFAFLVRRRVRERQREAEQKALRVTEDVYLEHFKRVRDDHPPTQDEVADLQALLLNEQISKMPRLERWIKETLVSAERQLN